jgi:hypothetical protein
MVLSMDLEQVRALYAHRPAEFVAARDALAKELKAAGAKDDAASVKRLRRHRPVEWVLNRVADVDAGVARAFADAAAAVRGAQAAAIEARSGGDVRAAMATLRERSTEVVAAAGRIDAAVPSAEVAGTLFEIAGDERGTEQFVAAILGSSELGDVDLFAGLEPDASRPRGRAPAARRTKRDRNATGPDRPVASADRGASDQTTAERRREDARVQAAERAEAALRRLDEARRAVEDAAAAEDAAARRVAGLRQELADAEGELRAASTARRRADTALTAADRAALRAAEKLADLASGVDRSAGT